MPPQCRNMSAGKLREVSGNKVRDDSSTGHSLEESCAQSGLSKPPLNALSTRVTFKRSYMRYKTKDCANFDTGPPYLNDKKFNGWLFS